MRDVLLALLLHIGILFCVVIAIGHAESALYRLGDVPRAVLRVLTGAKTKKRFNADAVQVCDFREYILLVLDRLNAIQLPLQRLGAHRFDRLFVHSACVIIANLLCLRRKLWVELRLGRLFGNRVQCVVVALD